LRIGYANYSRKTVNLQTAPKLGVMLALLLGFNFKKMVGCFVVGNPALSITGNSYSGSFVPGAFVWLRSKNRCGAFFVVCH